MQAEFGRTFRPLHTNTNLEGIFLSTVLTSSFQDSVLSIITPPFLIWCCLTQLRNCQLC